MVIGVCFKIVADFEDLTPSEWEEPQALDFRYIKKIFGCYDEAALETALRLQDQLRLAEQPVRTVAVTAGPPDSAAAEALLRSLFAAGFSDVVILPRCADFHPRSTAASLSDYFRENPADLILCGSMVGPGDSGMVPLHLAKELSLPFLPHVSGAAFDPAGQCLTVTSKDKAFTRRWQLTGPTVCALEDAEAAYLRLFPLKARLAARSRSFTPWPQAELPTDPPAELLPPEKISRSCRFLSPEEAPSLLLKLAREVTQL